MESVLIESIVKEGGIYAVITIAVVLFFTKLAPQLLDILASKSHSSGNGGSGSNSRDVASNGKISGASNEDALLELQKDLVRLTVQVELCSREVSQLSNKVDELIILLNRVDIHVSEGRMRGL